MTDAPDRPRYRPSGRLDTDRLLEALAVLAAGSLISAAAYCGMIACGVYFSALSVFLPVIVAAVATRAAVPGVLLGGTYFLAEGALPRHLVSVEVVAVSAIVIGHACIVFTRWWYNPERRLPFVLGVRYDHRLIRRAVAGRPGPLVEADDPRAVFAEMSPRRLWAQGSAKCGEYNQGLLLVDGGWGVLLFEGDYERYCIPAAAVQACDVEALPGMPATTAALYAVVLRVRLGGGVWEFPFFPLAGIEGRNNWERATALRRRVEGLCGQTFGTALPAPPRDPGPVVG